MHAAPRLARLVVMADEVSMGQRCRPEVLRADMHGHSHTFVSVYIYILRRRHGRRMRGAGGGARQGPLCRHKHVLRGSTRI